MAEALWATSMPKKETKSNSEEASSKTNSQKTRSVRGLFEESSQISFGNVWYTPECPKSSESAANRRRQLCDTTLFGHPAKAAQGGISVEEEAQSEGKETNMAVLNPATAILAFTLLLKQGVGREEDGKEYEDMPELEKFSLDMVNQYGKGLKKRLKIEENKNKGFIAVGNMVLRFHCQKL